jgi:uncharacterized protein YsxB (DUF464 family)
MVAIRIELDQRRCYCGFSCSGHAAYAKHGSDIICAAISILTQTIIASLEEIVRAPLEITADASTGYLHCTWVNQPNQVKQTKLLMQTLILGLTAIQTEYPNYISLTEVEV